MHISYIMTDDPGCHEAPQLHAIPAGTETALCGVTPKGTQKWRKFLLCEGNFTIEEILCEACLIQYAEKTWGEEGLRKAGRPKGRAYHINLTLKIDDATQLILKELQRWHANASAAEVIRMALRRQHAEDRRNKDKKKQSSA